MFGGVGFRRRGEIADAQEKGRDHEAEDHRRAPHENGDELSQIGAFVAVIGAARHEFLHAGRRCFTIAGLYFHPGECPTSRTRMSRHQGLLIRGRGHLTGAILTSY